MSLKYEQDNQSEDQQKFDLFTKQCELKNCLNVFSAIEYYARTNNIGLGAAVAELRTEIKKALKEIDELL